MMPEPPVNVRLTYANDVVVPVDTVYEGLVGGVHLWRVVNAPQALQIKAMDIDVLPPRTEVCVDIKTED